jgi:hypothetical protein
MVEKFGMDARYPLPSASAKFFMGAYFFVIVAGWFVGLGPHGWFWTVSLFVGIPWLGALSNYFHTLWCREGYDAAFTDMARLELDRRGVGGQLPPTMQAQFDTELAKRSAKKRS